MLFHTHDSDSEIIKVAISWLEQGYRPCVIYPKGFQKKQYTEGGSFTLVPASGKEPFGANWGSKKITGKVLEKDIRTFLSSGFTPGLGLCLGPERAPGGLGLMDIEGDGPGAEESRAKLFNGEVVSTIGHISVRGVHQFLSYDWDRLQNILAKLSTYQTKSQPGVYHLPQLPGLELRIGGINNQGKIKQLQTVIPPTPGTDGQPRTSNGISILAPAPEAFYTFLEQMAKDVNRNEPDGTESSESSDNDQGDNDQGDDESEESAKGVPENPPPDNPPASGETPKEAPKKRGRPKGSESKGSTKKKEKRETSIKDWLRKQFDQVMSEVESAAEGERHALLMSKVKWLAGYLHYGYGFSESELSRAAIDSANKSAPERKGDNPRCVREAITYGKTLPVKLPDHLHEKFAKFTKALGPILPKASTNGTGAHPREPGDDDPGGAIAGLGGVSGYNLTDLGNANRLMDLHGNDLCYVGRWKSWYTWKGDRWSEDDTGNIHHKCKDVVDLLRREAAILGPDDGEETIQWADRSEGVQRLDAIEKIARCDPLVIAHPKDFDSNLWYLNCVNGTLDLETGRLHPHIQSDKILKSTGTIYDPMALCPIWDQFLLTIFDNNKTLIDYLQRLTGYSAVGLTKEEIIVFLSGDGANGKTTYLETVAYVIGDYSFSCNPDLLIEVRSDRSHLHSLADMFGKRFVFTSDIKDNAKLAEGMVKQITGGSTIHARRLFENAFEFKPSHTIWFSANKAPDIQGRDYGIWRRIKRIPFEVKIPENQQDKNLKIKLQAERSGILLWILEGVQKWLKFGLAEPQVVVDAVEEYKEETDLYGPFFDDYCDQGLNYRCLFKELLDDFNRWADINGVYKVSFMKFSTILKARGFDRYRDNTNRFVLGVKPNGRLVRPGGNKWADRNASYDPVTDPDSPYSRHESEGRGYGSAIAEIKDTSEQIVYTPEVLPEFEKLDKALQYVAGGTALHGSITSENLRDAARELNIPEDSLFEAVRLMSLRKVIDTDTGEESWELDKN